MCVFCDMRKNHLGIQFHAFMIMCWVQICIKTTELPFQSFLYGWQLYLLLQLCQLLQHHAGNQPVDATWQAGLQRLAPDNYMFDIELDM